MALIALIANNEARPMGKTKKTWAELAPRQRLAECEGISTGGRLKEIM